MKKLFCAMAVLLLIPGAFAEEVLSPSAAAYNFFEITAVVLLAMVLSEVFIKNRLLLTYVWNVILMVSFVIVGVTALLYFMQIPGLNAIILTLHIRIGLIAVWVGFYHAAKRLVYYFKCFPAEKGGKCE